MKTTKTKLPEGTKTTGWADVILSKMKKEGCRTALKTVTVSELGFKDAPRTDELLDVGFLGKHGLMPCEPEDAYQALEDMEPGSYAYVGMKPIADSDGSPDVFLVECGGDGRRWLDAGSAGPGPRWDLDDRIVFRLRKSLGSEASEPSEMPSDALAFAAAMKLVKEAGYVIYKQI